MEEQEKGLTVKGFGEMQTSSKVDTKVFTNITDQKKIFNLETKVDCKLNDCEGEKIRVKEVLIKVIEKPLKEVEVDEETGEIIKDKETKRITILIDDNGKSYVTGSSMFTIQMAKYMSMFGISKEGFEIKIVKTPVRNSANKALGFELV